MSDDRDTVTHIGKSRGGGGGGGMRPTVVKGRSNLNNAFRNNNVTSEKKFGPVNSKSISTQHDTKVANNPDIIPPTKLNDAQITALRRGIDRKNLNQADVAQGVNESKGVIAKLLKGDPPQNTEERNKLLQRLERFLGVHMTGKQTGEFKLTKGEQAKAVREAAKNAAGK